MESNTKTVVIVVLILLLLALWKCHVKSSVQQGTQGEPRRVPRERHKDKGGSKGNVEPPHWEGEGCVCPFLSETAV